MRFIIVFLSIVLWNHVTLANPAVQPGAACSVDGSTVQSGGPETGGSGHFMVCQAGIWQSIMSYSSSGEITSFGDQVCANGQILSYDGSQWICSSKGQLQCTTVIGPNCPGGYTKTGYTPDLALGLGSYPVCCRVQ